MTDNEMQQVFDQLAFALELLNSFISWTTEIEAVDYSDLNQITWQAVQQSMPPLRNLLELFAEGIPSGAKIADNPAAFAHMMTVATAE